MPLRTAAQATSAPDDQPAGGARPEALKMSLPETQTDAPGQNKEKKIFEQSHGEEAPAKKWLWPLLRPLLPSFAEVFVISLFVNMLAITVPIFVLQVYDRVVFYAGITTLVGLVIGVAFALCFDFLLRQARSRMLQRVALKIDVRLGRKLFTKIQSLPMRQLESRPAHYWQMLFRDAEMIRNIFSGPPAVLVTDLPFAIIFLIVISIVAAPIAWVLAIILPLFIFVAWRSGQVVDHALKEERKSSVTRDELLSEMITGRATVKALALDQAIRPAWEDRHAATIEQSMSRGSRSDGFVNLGFVMTMGTTVSLVTVGALAIIDQKVTLGALIATVMLSNRIIAPFNQLVGTWRNLAGFKQAAARLSEIFGAVSERQSSALSMDRPKGRLTLEKVSFGYSQETPPVVDDLSLEIGPGGIHGVVGRNGSGKTTLVKLLNGLYLPDHGRVLLDGADISQFTRLELAEWIGYVPQECFLFAGTIRDNIAITRPDADDEAVLRAAKLSGVHDYVIDLPDGYGTDIGEAGGRLSGGQRQRIAIARALLMDPPILLLDEASGNLDAEAELALRDTLMRLSQNHTIILVTHTPALLRACRTVVVLEKGKIALSGPADQVLPRIIGTPRAQGGGQRPAQNPAQNAAQNPAQTQSKVQSGGRVITPTNATSQTQVAPGSNTPSRPPPPPPAPAAPGQGAAPTGPGPIVGSVSGSLTKEDD